ncbi:GTPase IMAP member 4 [Bulinus truncatus]|nr:GTPase IMAP member 4 [Bulinus truncatus]
MNHYTEVNLMLIGKTGNGKSATGNSILRRKCFRTSGSATAVTNKIDYEVGKFDGRKVTVVDVPGVCDNSTDNESGAELVLRCLQEAVYLSPDGYNAFILVVKFGSRFTGEELKTPEFLKNVFGETFVKKFCILVLSGGDVFQEEVKSEGTSLKVGARNKLVNLNSC